MPTRLQEIEIGDWYQTPVREERFEIVAMDESERTLEIQYYDGTVEEVDFESWPQLEAEAAHPPEDWAGAYDADREDIADDDGQAQLSLGDPYDDIDQLLY